MIGLNEVLLRYRRDMHPRSFMYFSGLGSSDQGVGSILRRTATVQTNTSWINLELKHQSQ